MTIFLFTLTGFKRPKNTKLALNRNASMMRHFSHPFGDIEIIRIRGWCFRIGFQRPIHHHRGESILDGCHTGGFVVAMVLVHAHWNMRVHFSQCLDHCLQHQIASVVACTAAGLNNNRRIHPVSRFQYRQPLFHIIDIKCRHTIAMFGSIIEKLAKGNQHQIILLLPCLR